MNPFDLIIWVICIVTSLWIISSLGIHDWVLKNIFHREPYAKIESQVDKLTKRVEKLEAHIKTLETPHDQND